MAKEERIVSPEKQAEDEKNVNALPVGSTMFRYDTHILIYDNITGN